MEKKRQTKFISIIALIFGVCALAIGFSAFSATLNISSSATVTPNSEDFKLTVYGVKNKEVYDKLSAGNYIISDDDISDSYGVATGSVVASDASVDNSTHTISNLKANFVSEGVAVYFFVVKNEGKFDAYLDMNNMILEGGDGNVLGSFFEKTCTPVESDSNPLVEAACEGIGAVLCFVDKNTGEEILVTEDYYKIGLNDYEILGVSIFYDGPLSDEAFEVAFEDLELKFSTVK